jgi:hypothetical protein
VRLGLVLLAAVIVAGCASQFDVAGVEWGKPGATINQVTLDELECARDAADVGQTYDAIVGGVVDVVRVIIEERARTASFNDCMTSRGYTKRA